MEYVIVLVVIVLFIVGVKAKTDEAQKKINRKLNPKPAPRNKAPTSPKEPEWDYPTEVAGTEYRQDAIKKAVIQLCKDSGDEFDPEDFYQEEVSASLIPEPDNEHDPNAVKVVIKRQHVGYLPRSLAASYPGGNKRCKAEISGGEEDYQVSISYAG